MSIWQKLLIVPIVLVLALGVVVFTVIQSIESQRNDGILIDAAGRQRMLNQRYVKEVFLEAQFPQTSKSNLASENTSKLFSETLDALTYGGTLTLNPGNGTTTIIAAPSNADLISLLK